MKKCVKKNIVERDGKVEDDFDRNQEKGLCSVTWHCQQPLLELKAEEERTVLITSSSVSSSCYRLYYSPKYFWVLMIEMMWQGSVNRSASKLGQCFIS